MSKIESNNDLSVSLSPCICVSLVLVKDHVFLPVYVLIIGESDRMVLGPPVQYLNPTLLHESKTTFLLYS